MKKALIALVVALLINTLVFSQRLNDDKWKNPCPTCLPGVSYGFDWPVPPKPQDPDPGNPVILQWTGDLSVTISQAGQVYQYKDQPYFAVVYSVTVTNTNTPGPLTFHLRISKRYDPPQFTILDQSVLNVPNKFYEIKELKVGEPKTFQDTVHVLYPFTAKSRAAKSKFLQIPVDVIAEIPTSILRSGASPVVLTDANLENNKSKFTLTTPLPLKYSKPNTN